MKRKPPTEEQRERCRQKAREWYRNNKERAAVSTKRWVEKNRKRKYANNDKWNRANTEYHTEYIKRYRQRPGIREHINAMDRERMKIPHNRITKNLRKRIWDALQGNGNTKSDTTEKLLGCTIKEFMRHLERQFTVGMTWDNYGEWHVDHIRPCASFELSSPAQQKICFHHVNLQPLWALDNIRKRDSMCRCALTTRIP